MSEEPLINKLSFLEGIWRGRGVARFPTIATTEYLEELEFRFSGDDESLIFEQRSWHIINNERGKPLHLESGFIIACPDGSFELLNAQNSKRVEVLKCAGFDPGNTAVNLSFESVYFGNDKRMIRSRRDYSISGNSMIFRMCMATVNTPEFQEHLRSELERAV